MQTCQMANYARLVGSIEVTSKTSWNTITHRLLRVGGLCFAHNLRLVSGTTYATAKCLQQALLRLTQHNHGMDKA